MVDLIPLKRHKASLKTRPWRVNIVLASATALPIPNSGELRQPARRRPETSEALERRRSKDGVQGPAQYTQIFRVCQPLRKEASARKDPGGWRVHLEGP